MDERRRIKRKYLLYYARVFEAKSNNQLGHLVDITPDGAMVLSKEPIRTDIDFELKVELTSDVSDKDFLTFSAKSVWCQPDIDPHMYNTGFKFITIDKNDIGIIRKIIEKHGFRDN